MTIFQLIDILQKLAKTQPNVRTTSEGDIYRTLNNNPQTEYDVVHIMQNQHQHLEYLDRYNLTIFFVSRLVDDLDSNRLQCQSVGKEVLNNIIRDFCDMYELDFPQYSIQVFTEKFIDLCAGCYINITFEIPTDACADDFSDIISIYQTKTVNLTENGQFIVTPDESYTALEKVIINVDVECESYEQGYEDGFESGVTNQKNKLTSIYIDENGQYNRTDGFSSVTVNVPQGDYQEGYEDGMEAQKALLSSITITTNGDYSYENGYSAITVNVPQSGGGDYQQGFEDGVEYQKSLLSSATFNQNGNYTNENGYSAVTIDVSGYTQEDIDRAYWRGYQDGLNDCSGSTDYSSEYLTFEFMENGTFKFILKGVDEVSSVSTLEYNKNNSGWETLTTTFVNHHLTAETLNVNSGDIIKLRADGVENTHYELYESGSCIVYGNIMSIVDKTNFVNLTTINSGITFNNTFSYCDGLTDAKNLVLPATTLTNWCYHQMFNLCDELLYAPKELPATTLAEHCYCEMFGGCRKLISVPSCLPATTMAYHCYNEMFANCSSLVNAPIISATTLAESCFSSMFLGCTSLTSAPVLLATTILYNSYTNMFKDCSNLNYIKCLATTDKINISNWVNGVSETGTFVKAAGTTWATGTSGIPSGWTIIDAS